MNPTQAYDALLAHLRRIAALDQVADFLNWDQETQMPPLGTGQRAIQAGAVAAAAHALRTDPRIAEWCDAAARPDLPEVARANLVEARRLHGRAVRLPADLAEALARETALAQSAWQAARVENAVGPLAPPLERVVALTRERALCLAGADGDPYDALLDEFEPGATGESLAVMFGRLRAGLTDLRARIGASGRGIPKLEGRFPGSGQLQVARRVAGAFGYDWRAGRLDLAEHPSSSGTGGDVRITTRIDETDPQNCVYSVIHEVGHAVYEQGLDPELGFQPAGAHASMGVHESQSRLFENQFGRSREFCGWLHAALTSEFGTSGATSAEAFHRAVNRVETGFVRTDADEVHYNLHVMMRFDMERALVGGDLAVSDLEAAWNDRFARDFGRAVPDARRGVLQDVHWPEGLFGYFPTYTIGNVYAACLYLGLRRDIPDLDRGLAEADIGSALDWLRARIHRIGRRLAPADLIARACGRVPDETALLEYLEEKYGELYGM